MEEIYSQMLNLIQGGKQGVLVTITKVKGSVPRHAGSKMLVKQNGSIIGTIGGGKIEADVIQEALELIESNTLHQKTYDLTEDEGMLCGGTVEVLFEPFGKAQQLLIFGAGHIAHSLAPLARKAGFAVTVIDNRVKYANPERFPDANSIVSKPFPEALKTLDFTYQTYIVIVTHAHAYDEEILAYCLDQPYAYLGMIASKRKSKTILNTLREKGSPEEQLEKVHTPIGLDIGAETPFEIAISILSEIIGVRHSIDISTLTMKK